MPYGVPHHGGWGTGHMEAQPMQMGHQEARQPRYSNWDILSVNVLQDLKSWSRYC